MRTGHNNSSSGFYRYLDSTTIIFLIVVGIIVLLPSCISSDKEKDMYRLLEQAEMMNKEYIPMDTISYMEDVLEYFTSHGNKYERIKANYMMGCIYRDRGDSPMALEYYLTAVNLEDTLAKDCDFKQLCRIYSQIAVVYHKQRYPQKELEMWNAAISMANKAKDSLMIYQCKGKLSGVYHLIGDFETAFKIKKEAYLKFKELGEVHYAASSLSYLINYYLNKDSIEAAKDALDEYKRNSMVMDKNGNVKRGKELLYYYFGLYHEKTCNMDSSLYYYRKLLHYPDAIMNLESGYRGLMSVYASKNMIDSAVKYMKMYADANDTANIRNSANEISRVKALYDYSEFQKEAKEKAEEATRLWLTIYFAILILALLVVGGYITLQNIKKKTLEKLKEANNIYSETLIKYIQSRKELSRLKSNHKLFEKEKRDEIKALHDILEKYEEGVNVGELNGEHCIHLNTYVKKMHKYASIIKIPTESDWDGLMHAVCDFLPEFYSHLSGFDKILSENEMKICILTRLCFSPSEILVLMNITIQNVTNIRGRINQKLFNDRSARTFNRNISHL